MSGANGNAWNPTMELRWLEMPLWADKRNGQRGQDMMGTRRILQQRFVCDQTGQERWADVPTVNTRELKRQQEQTQKGKVECDNKLEA